MVEILEHLVKNPLKHNLRKMKDDEVCLDRHNCFMPAIESYMTFLTTNLALMNTLIRITPM